VGYGNTINGPTGSDNRQLSDKIFHVVTLSFKANSHMPCRAHAVPLPCRAALIHTGHAAPLPFSDSAVSFVKYASDNNLRGTPGGSRKKPNTGRSPTCRLWTADANSHMPCHAHARCAVALRSRFQNSMVVAWHGRGMACVNQTRPHCVNQMGKAQSKPLAARHGRGMVCMN
jgi:hypothetical protein